MNKLFKGFNTSYLSLAAMALTIYGLVFDVDLAVYIGVAIVFTERLVIMVLIAYATHLQKKLAEQLYGQMTEAAEILKKQIEASSKSVGPGSPYDPEKENR